MGKRLGALARLIKNRADDTISNTFLNDLIRTIENDNKDEYKPTPTYKPSSIGGCLRNIYYQMTEAPTDNQPDDYALIGIGESGSTRHEYLQTYVTKMKEQGFDWEWVDVEEFVNTTKPEGTRVVKKQGMETKCHNDIYNLRFLCDGVVKHKGEYFILEIKTESTYKYGNHDKPFEEHEMQAACYSIALGINRVIFLYENRDLCMKKCYLVEVKEDIKDRVLDKIFDCDEYIDDGIVPPKTEKVKDCQYCNYKLQCRKDGKGV